jgi:hypothetical protein
MWFDPAFSLSQVVLQTSAVAPQQQTIDLGGASCGF